ncbi:hypothetical protein Vadar_014972 [Vaccinium darrowii]|uniref:Uncharacterized protein n=1 Tax=Vaccinium darrowii TaxID=229202 RepID=A0ACB7XQQ4_9ERIC|nr:hypothetical protein Vadar_014972 [Vaccinium darrowii]
MSVTPTVATPIPPIGSSSDNITAKEEDHLIRSIKKIKNDQIELITSMDAEPVVPDSETPRVDTIVDDEMGMGEEKGEEALAPPKELIKSFMQILINTEGKEVAFSEDVENIPFDEESMGEEENICEDEERDGIPVINFPKSLMKYGTQPWKNAIIVKPIGYPIGYKALCTKVRRLWDLQGDFSAIDIGMGFVVFKFDVQSDRDHVLTGGPWTLSDQYITVRAWEPRFKPDETEEITTAVWVRFPNFPFEYYNEKHMF